MSKKVWLVLFSAYCCFIVWMTLLSRTVTTRRCDLRLFWAFRELATGRPEGWKDTVQYLDNILFFIPFGFLFSLIVKGGWKKVVLTGVIVSASIEFIQFIAALGLAEIDDVISNTLGVAIGFGVWILMRKVVESHK